MVLFKIKVKKIGSDLWVIIPKKIITKEGLHEGEDVRVSLRRKPEGF